MQIDRIKFLKEVEEEKLLRESIRNVISVVRERKKTKLKEQQNNEKHLRMIVRRLLNNEKKLN